MDKEMEIIKLESFLQKTDYKIIQYVEGEIDEEEFRTIKAKRHEARERIRELKA